MNGNGNASDVQSGHSVPARQMGYIVRRLARLGCFGRTCDARQSACGDVAVPGGTALREAMSCGMAGSRYTALVRGAAMDCAMGGRRLFPVAFERR